MNRRTLIRALAVAVALAAISPLIVGADSNGGNQANCGQQKLSARAGEAGMETLNGEPNPHR